LVLILVSKNQIRNGFEFGSGSGIKNQNQFQNLDPVSEAESEFLKMILFRGNWGTNQKLTASFVPGYLEPDQNQL
jgi:hypothetical protein